MCLVLLLFVSLSIVCGGGSDDIGPNIIIFLTDDWGMNDLSYYGNTDTQTPFIDSLMREESVVLSKNYMSSLCSVSRVALLTGRYPLRYGLQENILYQTSNFALSKQETLISNEFNRQGYSTHLIGKWHAGFLGWDYTPTYRGFDTFMGYYGSQVDYYEKVSVEHDQTGFDFRLQTNEYDIDADKYTLDIYNDYLIEKIHEFGSEEYEKEHENEPFFMYIGWQGSHSPEQAPESYLEMYTDGNSSYSDIGRIAFQAQTTMTDDLFKEFIGALKESEIWDNTLILFSSDNGADTDNGDNSPLRSGKGSLYEGGVRVPAFLTGGYLPIELRGSTFDTFPIHVTDWYPTLLNIAGLQVSSNNKLDGKNVWPLIKDSVNNNKNENKNNKETDDDEYNYYYGEWYVDNELIGEKELSLLDKTEELTIDDMNERVLILSVNSGKCDTDACGALIYGGRWKILINGEGHWFWSRKYSQNENNDALGCGEIPDDTEVNISDDPCESQVCLFDLMNDPCEYYDVSDNYPILAGNLFNVLKYYYNAQTPPLFSRIGYVDNDTESLLISDNGYWQPVYDVNTWQELTFEQFLLAYYNDDDHEVISMSNNMNQANDHIVTSFSFSNSLVAVIVIFFLCIIIFAIYSLYCTKNIIINNNEKFDEKSRLLIKTEIINVSQNSNYEYLSSNPSYF